MIKKLGSIVVLIIAFVGGKYLVENGIGLYQESKSISAVEAQFSEMEKDAEALTLSTEKPKSVALQEVAIKAAEERLNSQTSALKKRQTALSTFMGFYLVNYRTRSDYCNSLGINISTFTNRFDSLHQNELALSKKHVFKKPSDIEKIYGSIKPQLEKALNQDMVDISEAYSVTTTGACELIEQNGIAFAEEMMLSKIQPSVYNAIHYKN